MMSPRQRCHGLDRGLQPSQQDRCAACVLALHAPGAAHAPGRLDRPRSPRLYYAAAKIGLRLAYLHGAVTALWPPVGVGIAALVLYGPRLWPGIVIGDLLVADFSTPLGTVFGQTVGNTLEVARRRAAPAAGWSAAGTGLERVRRRVRARRCRRGRDADQRELRRRVAAAGQRHPLGRVLRGLAHVVAVGLLGRARGHAPDPHLGDPRRATALARDLLEGAALLTALVLLAELPSQRDVPYVVFPVLIWAALRFGPRGAATALVVVSALTVWNTAHNAGPFVRQSITDSLLSSQLFLADRGADLARARRGDRGAHPRRRGAARQRGAIALGGAVDGRGPHRARRARGHHRLQRGRGADPRASAARDFAAAGPRTSSAPRSTARISAVLRRPAPGRRRARLRRSARPAHGAPDATDGTPAWVCDQLGARPRRRRPSPRASSRR